jgi:serine/threonine protein kinase
MTDVADDRHPVEALAEEFAARYRAGENPSITEYLTRCPEHAAEIADLFPAVTLLEDLKDVQAGPPPQEAPPAQLGDFRIVREVGRGGMGVVYEAVQLSLGRRVALKVLPSRLRLCGEPLARFQREARAAARLHHTNIVPVFGVGEHDGLPYYVMQLIDGQGLDRVMARLRLARQGQAAPPGFPALSGPAYYRHAAGLLAQAADALAHAHAQGVLHRDIKPANLLLDDRGTLWVTDFGLAKQLEQDDITRTGEMAGTLRYSAPERFVGQSDARGDVYGLGLTLYELLTLHPAYDETDPGRLLVQATQGRLAGPRAHDPALPRDLETVVLKALAPEPARRYPTAADLADDLRRFLDDRPVKARRSSPLGRLLRWRRRNPAVAALSLALAAALLLGLAGVAWKWREASAHLAQANAAAGAASDALGREAGERRRADAQRQRAQGNLDLALEAFERITAQLALARPDAPLDAGGEEAPAHPVASPEAAAVLQDLVRFYERFAATNSNDPRLQRDTARALRQVGAIRLRLGQYPQAQQALRRALALLVDPFGALERARLLNELGVALRASGKAADAARTHQAALDELKAVAGPDARHEEARALNLLGTLQWRLGQTAPAERSQRDALALLAKLVQDKPAHPGYRHTQARAQHGLSVVLWASGRRGEGAEARVKALEVLEALARDFPAVPDYRADLAEILLTLTPRMPLPRDYREAGRRVGRALELAEGLNAGHPGAPEYQFLLARARLRQGGLLLRARRYPEAVHTLRKAVRATSDLLGRYPRAPGFKASAFEARLSLGDALRQQGELGEAEKVLRESLAAVPKAFPAGPRSRFVRGLLARHYHALGLTLRRLGKKAEADEALARAEELGKP